MSIGKNIAHFRKNKGFTQEKLGEMIGVTNQAVSKWESESSLPDVMLLPRIAAALEVSLEDLFAESTTQTAQTAPDVFDMEAVHDFPKTAQTTMIDTLCIQTNLINCNSWDLLRAEQNPSTKKYDQIRPFYTMCCVSDTAGAAFVSNTLTMIDSDMRPPEIGSVFEKTEIASGMKKLADSNVRCVLSCVCREYFQRSVTFDDQDSEYFTIDMQPHEISRTTGLSVEDVLEAIEKLISLHIVDLETNQGTRYWLHKIKAVEAAVTLRMMERLMYNEVGFACGEFFALTRY